MTFQVVVPALWGQLAILYIAAILLYYTSKVLYSAYFHPLATYPEPKFAAISNIAHCYWFLGGRQPYKLLDLHKRYDTVVRTAPNELSFSSSQSWKDIYAFRPGHKTFIKSEFCDGGSFADQAHSIVSERDPIEHGKMRKYLSHAFSDRSLFEQEHLISGVIDNYILKLGKIGPERWIGQNTKDILDASQPFSLGPRGCLGRNLAWVELRTILAKLHFSYDLNLLDKNLDWHRDSKMQTLWQRPPLEVGVEKRTM